MRQRRQQRPVSRGEPHPIRTGLPLPDTKPDEGPTDLERLVAAARDAAELSSIAPPRSPWLDPLPAEVQLPALPSVTHSGLQSSGTVPAIALADDPDRQAQYPVGWDPAASNLLLFGASGCGTTSALATLALGLAGACPPDALHVYVLDLGAGKLATLGELLHAGAYIGSAERERQARCVRLLRREVDARKAAPGAARPDWLVLIDNFASLIAEYGKDAAGQQVLDDLKRAYAEGPTVGIRFAVAVDRAGAMPGPWVALTQQKLLFRLADARDYSAFEVGRGAVPSPVPAGRWSRPRAR